VGETTKISRYLLSPLITDRWLFAFLLCLIHHKWFKEIQLIFLPVGHTHDCVDRDLFAPIGNRKKLHNVETPARFPEFVQKCFRRVPIKPTVVSTIFVWDWKAMLGEHMRATSNFQDFRAFKFIYDGRKQLPVMFYKDNILETRWLGYQSSFEDGICTVLSER